MTIEYELITLSEKMEHDIDDFKIFINVNVCNRLLQTVKADAWYYDKILQYLDNNVTKVSIKEDPLTAYFEIEI